MALFENMPDIKAKTKDSKLLGALAYLPIATLLVPIIVYVASKEDKYAKFHALNALGFQLGVGVLGFIFIMLALMFQVFTAFLVMISAGIAALITTPMFFLAWFFAVAFMGVFFLLSLYLMYMAYEGKAFRLPVVTDIVMKHAWS